MGFLAKVNGKEPTADGIMIIVLWAEFSSFRSTFRLNSGTCDHFFSVQSTAGKTQLLLWVLSFQNWWQRFKNALTVYIGFWAIQKSGFGIKPVSLSLLSTATGGKSNLWSWFGSENLINRSVVRSSLWDSLSVLFRNPEFQPYRFFLQLRSFSEFLAPQRLSFWLQYKYARLYSLKQRQKTAFVEFFRLKN